MLHKICNKQNEGVTFTKINVNYKDKTLILNTDDNPYKILMDLFKG